MKIVSEGLDALAAYKLLTGLVVPRPIAWVTTLAANGKVNVAPFSCYTYVSARPPMLGFNSGRLREHNGVKTRERKDTAVNIFANGEFVVNIVDESLLEPMHLSADYFPADVSETEVLGLETVPSDIVGVPRLKASPVSAECKFSRAVEFGETGAEFIVGEIKVFHIRDDLYADGKIDTRLLRPLARLAGPTYGSIGEFFPMRPNKQR